MSTILDSISSSSDIKTLSLLQLNQLAEEVRKLIIETVSKTGGHLAPNLGTVELTIALLRVFDPPTDKVLWDVGHQTYTYKILTSRRDKFHTLRQFKGISGFLKREESEYDIYGAGHSGTALSAALGLAVARDRRGGNEHVVAVVGDGALGCGLSLEALNNLSTSTKRLIVILNDNKMCIARNVGAIARSLGRILASPIYNRIKGAVERFALRLKLSVFRSLYYRLEEITKGFFLRSFLFEEFGLRYIGPVDGHNINRLIDAFNIARLSDKPVVVHVVTRKGLGYSYAEIDSEKWHSTPPFDVATGQRRTKSAAPTYSEIFGITLEKLAEEDSRIVAITAAMPEGTGLTHFAQRFPNRFFNVGICEEHAVVFSAGLAAGGLIPVFAVYSTFMQRAVDCVIHDVCLQKLPVVFCLDHAGIVPEDGPTHHGVFDIALLRPVPGLVFMQPKDEAELADMLYTAVKLGKPVAIRYPKGSGPGVKIKEQFVSLPIGKAEVLKHSPLNLANEKPQQVQIWALGDMLPLAFDTAVLLEKSGIPAGVVSPRFIKPLDEELLMSHANSSSAIVTIENGVIAGGFGTAIEEFLMQKGIDCRIFKLGWRDEYIPQGSKDELMKLFGLTPEAVFTAISSALSQKTHQ